MATRGISFDMSGEECGERRSIPNLKVQIAHLAEQQSELNGTRGEVGKEWLRRITTKVGRKRKERGIIILSRASGEKEWPEFAGGSERHEPKRSRVCSVAAASALG